jgi:hypothetical protein
LQGGFVKKLLLILVKIGVSAAIIGYLVLDAYRNQAFGHLLAQPKNWWLLTGAGLFCGSAVVVTLVRWCYLVRALDLPFAIKDAMRLGFLGYLFNLAPMGIVSGDLLKAVMLARQQHGHRAKAVASVVIDRLIGLYMLMVVASVAILLTGFYQFPDEKIRHFCQAILALTVGGAVGIAVMFMPDPTGGRLSALVSRIPLVGGAIVQLGCVLAMYRRRMGVLVVACAMSIAVHSLYATGIFLLTWGLYPQSHTLGTQFVAAPLAALTGVVPVPAGPFEWVLDRLFSSIPLPDGGHMLTNQGFVVALGYRIITVGTAAIGAMYYLVSRQELAAALHDVEETTELDEQPATADSAA